MDTLDIVISNAGDQPIYDQIASQVKGLICSGKLAEGEQLPSIRALANALRVSVITTKRAYADLEAAGFVRTVPGRGCFVAGGNAQLVREEGLREMERLMAASVRRGRELGLSDDELLAAFLLQRDE